MFIQRDGYLERGGMASIFFKCVRKTPSYQLFLVVLLVVLQSLDVYLNKPFEDRLQEMFIEMDDETHILGKELTLQNSLITAVYNIV